jgi:hypothetical protein
MCDLFQPLPGPFVFLKLVVGTKTFQREPVKGLIPPYNALNPPDAGSSLPQVFPVESTDIISRLLNYVNLSLGAVEQVPS